MTLITACGTGTGTTPQESPVPKFYKAKASDKQMTSDLNDCAYLSFKSAAHSDSPMDSSIKGPLMKKCMQSKGYTVSY